MNYTYILRCADNTLYTGWTTDPEKRLKAHNEGRGAKYTRTRRPVQMVYCEAFATKEEAMSREWHIKRFTREKKEQLIAAYERNPMRTQAFNPYLPNYEYIPDGEPYVFGDRLYIYGSHDKYNGEKFCMNDYVCWSASVDDLANFRYEGVIYRKDQDPHYREGKFMYAPDITQGPDGRYYLYYTLDTEGIMSVAVGDGPVGPFEYYGDVCYPDGRAIGTQAGDQFQFDPGVFVDDDGRVYLYTGFGPGAGEAVEKRFKGKVLPGAVCFELRADMITLEKDHGCIMPQKAYVQGTPFEEHPFFEASSIRKIGDTYYFVYSSSKGHELCYATSKKPYEGFVPGGCIVSNGDIGVNGVTRECPANYTSNNHGGMVEIKGQWYIFYHRHTNYHSFSRQGCAEPITILPDGSIPQAEITSCGLNGGPLKGEGYYSSAIACNLMSAAGACFIDDAGKNPEKHPVFRQTGVDGEETETQYITNLSNGCVAGFKYFDLAKTMKIAVKVKGSAGVVIVRNGREGSEIARIAFPESAEYRSFEACLDRAAIEAGEAGRSALYFTFETEGSVDFAGFTLS